MLPSELASRRYFAGHDVLFPDAAAGLAAFIDHAEHTVSLYNTAIGADLDDAVALEAGSNAADTTPPPGGPCQVDTVRFRAGTGPLVGVMLGFLSDHARSKALDDIGEGRQAREIMERYLSSESAG